LITLAHFSVSSAMIFPKIGMHKGHDRSGASHPLVVERSIDVLSHVAPSPHIGLYAWSGPQYIRDLP